MYCDLKFDKKAPPPPEFILLSGGDADYKAFQAGHYRHVIFNLTLQEGWDDPECYLAYIDKDMGSRVQCPLANQVPLRVVNTKPPDSHCRAAIRSSFLRCRLGDVSAHRGAWRAVVGFFR